MKKFLLLMLLLLNISAYAQQQGKTSTLKFDTEFWNFGRIKEVNGVVSHIFNFTNTGSKPIVIEEIITTCGCTTSEYSKAPIMPNSKGSIKIFFDPSNRPGAFIKEVEIWSNSRRNVNIIKLKGEVIARPRTVEDDYQYELISGIRLSNSIVNFKYIEQGKAVSMTLGYANTSKKAVSITLKPESSKPYFSVSSPGSVAAGSKGLINFTYNLTKQDVWGILTENVYLTINGHKINTPIPVTATATDNFDKVNIKKAPKLKLNSQFFHFGEVSRKDKLSKVFTITNEGSDVLIIRHIDAKNVTTTLSEGATVAPGKSINFSVSLKQPDVPDRISGSVVIIANDPQRPMREIRLIANVTK